MRGVASANLGHQIFALWCTPIFSVLLAAGWLGLAHFWLPAPADLGAEATKAFFTIDHREGVLLGNSILIVASAFLVPASIQFGLMLARIEGAYPMWSLTAGVSGTFIALIVFFNGGFWIGAAYRAQASADVVVALNDVAWFGFLLGWVFLSLQMIATALIALSDKRARPMIPRHVSHASLAGSILLVCAGGPAFFQHGPMAYHGWAAFYMPMAIWGLWLNAHAWYMGRELTRIMADPDNLQER